jgi:DNA-directed RNA polymerase specialized sigma24 family protein
LTARHRRYAEDQGAAVARLDDAALIERSWHEPEAFAALYDRHAAPIHRFAGRRLGDQMADDVVAETFLAAFRRRKRYDLHRADARPWLYGIAANVIGKHRRAEVRMLRAFARTGADPVAAGHADLVDSRVCAAAVQRDLAAALAGLSAEPGCGMIAGVTHAPPAGIRPSGPAVRIVWHFNLVDRGGGPRAPRAGRRRLGLGAHVPYRGGRVSSASGYPGRRLAIDATGNLMTPPAAT